MALGKIKDRLTSPFKRRHPDIYKAVKEYADERGVAVADVMASAASSYLAADEEGKETLEKAMAERAATGGKGGADVTAAVDMFVKLSDGVTKMFNAVNEMKNAVSINSIIADFEAMTTAMDKLRTKGAEKGSGSLEDKVADAFVEGLIKRVTGGASIQPKKTKQTGIGEVSKVEDEPSKG